MIKIGIVVAEFNGEITRKMLEIAKKHALKSNAKIAEIAYVSGVFDIPLAVKILLKKKSIDCVATLGAVVKGETSHDELISDAVAKSLIELSLEFEKPVSLGISGPNMSWQQAVDRTEDYAKRSIEAAIKSAKFCKK